MMMRILSGSVIRDGGSVRVTTNAIMRDEHDREAIRHITAVKPDSARTTGSDVEALMRDLTERDEMLMIVRQRRNAMLAEKAARINTRPGRMIRAGEKAKAVLAVIIATVLFSIPTWYDEHRESVDMWTMALGILVTTVLWAWALAKIAICRGWVG